MKILVLSDTHGKIDKAVEIINAEKDLDLVVHAGDHSSDAMAISAKIRPRLVFVRGNNDPEESGPAYYVINTEAGDILLTHGHLDRVNFNQQTLYYHALEMGCVAAIYGHTHLPAKVEFDKQSQMAREDEIEDDEPKMQGFLLINPGSLERPFDGSQGSYAILETYEGGIKAQIKYYANSKKPKVQGGHLRSLLNYSDRF